MSTTSTTWPRHYALRSTVDGPIHERVPVIELADVVAERSGRAIGPWLSESLRRNGRVYVAADRNSGWRLTTGERGFVVTTEPGDFDAHRPDSETHCHCQAEYGGSDHCPACGCEQYESYSCLAR